MNSRPSRRTLFLLGCGVLALVGGLVLYTAVPGEDYRMHVMASDADTAANASERDAAVYAYDELDPATQSVFREGQAAAGEEITVRADRWPESFEYGTDTAGVTVVSDRGTYYVVRAWQTQCLAALCDVLRAVFLGVAGVGVVALGVGVKRVRTRRSSRR
ncbi:hypothetical protein [Haloarcula sediminis]|uniref:hypothetical protein n=1 Tax=Haloarcula sediminis TaxID=3111777 RepID=UPI002D769C90|nr:hypothetical protein [Haloarcula sp. CK38]